MRWTRRLNESERDAAKQTCHYWFAWHPVDIGGRKVAWLEYVLRTGCRESRVNHDEPNGASYLWTWVYKALGDKV